MELSVLGGGCFVKVEAKPKKKTKKTKKNEKTREKTGKKRSKSVKVQRLLVESKRSCSKKGCLDDFFNEPWQTLHHPNF